MSSGFINHYECPCGAIWQEESACTNDDRCPWCDASCTPQESEDLDDAGDDVAAAELEEAVEYATELTPIGEQYVIPGCEHDTTRGTTPGQLKLWD